MRVFERLHLFDMGPENGVVRRQFADAKLPPRIVCVQIVRVSRHPSPPQKVSWWVNGTARGSQPLTRLVTFPGVNPFGRSVSHRGTNWGLYGGLSQGPPIKIENA